MNSPGSLNMYLHNFLGLDAVCGQIQNNPAIKEAVDLAVSGYHKQACCTIFSLAHMKIPLKQPFDSPNEYFEAAYALSQISSSCK
eukprot:UC4_evm1s826